MKITAILTAMLGLVLGSLHAQTVPPFINYQGTVTDSAGLGLGTVTPVNRKVIFRIFDAATGGNRLWSEQHTVTISDGQFSVLLGNGINANYAGVDEVPLKTATPLDTVFTSAGILRYVEIVVDNGDNTLDAADAPIAPRQQITSTAYSFRARSADTIASGSDLQLNGSDNYGLGYYGSTRLFNGAAIDGPVLFGQAGGALGSVNGGTKNIALRWNENGAVGIGSADLTGASALTKLVLQGDDTSTAPQQLNIRGNTDTNKRLLLGYNTTSNYGSLQAYSAASTATNLLLNRIGGNVGIGTASTPSKLTIASVGNDYGLTIVGASTAPGLTMQNNNPGGQKFSMFVGSTNPGSVQGLSIFDENALAYRFVVKSDGNVGIGTTSPSQKLSVNGNANFTGNVGIGTTTPSGKLDVNGDMYAGGASGGSRFWFTGNQIQQYSNEVAAAMHLNLSGGNVLLCGSASAGNVGIGTSAPAYKLDVTGTLRVTGDSRSTQDFKQQGAGPFGMQWVDVNGNRQAHIFRYSSPTLGDNRLYFSNNGYSNLTGVYLAVGGTSLTSTSDERLKSDIEPLTGILDKISDIRVVGFNMASTSIDTETGKMKVGQTPQARTTKNGKVIKQEIGSIAQDWVESFPELVVEPHDADGFYGLNYDRIGVVALGAAKELNEIVVQQEAEIASLTARLASLEARDLAREAQLAAIQKQLLTVGTAAVE